MDGRLKSFTKGWKDKKKDAILTGSLRAEFSLRNRHHIVSGSITLGKGEGNRWLAFSIASGSAWACAGLFPHLVGFRSSRLGRIG